MSLARPVVDVARIRADFPALRSGAAHFDSPGGTQTPEPVIEAMAATLRAPLANRGGPTPAQRNAEASVHAFRAAIADFVGGRADGVVFGRSATQLTLDMARTLAKGWRPGDEVIVTRLDHDANVRPWIIAAATVGAAVRWAEFDPATGELSPDVVRNLLTARTRLVAVTAASNLIGTIPDLAAISADAHAVGALVFVDGVHYAAHALVEVTDLGADFFVCSPYKFFGPHHGVLVADPDLLADLRPDKLLPSSDAVPERFELGTLPYEMLSGTTAAIDYLAGLAGATGTRRERLRASFDALATHEHHLSYCVETGLRERGAALYSNAAARTPTLLFHLPGRTAPEVSDALARHGVNAPAGCFYAIEASRHLGLGDSGAVRVGLAPYNDTGDVQRLLAGLDAG